MFLVISLDTRVLCDSLSLILMTLGTDMKCLILKHKLARVQDSMGLKKKKKIILVILLIDFSSYFPRYESCMQVIIIDFDDTRNGNEVLVFET